jgi:hypothetical protein
MKLLSNVYVNVFFLFFLFFPHVRLLRYPLGTIVCHGATISPSSPQSRLMNRFIRSTAYGPAHYTSSKEVSGLSSPMVAHLMTQALLHDILKCRVKYHDILKHKLLSKCLCECCMISCNIHLNLLNIFIFYTALWNIM